ncbi:MAG: phosphate ABC transporter permease PstA [Synechococcales bacterium]|nr:phosphate ABC transporter permease PstA [Synechococcales bacterium]
MSALPSDGAIAPDPNIHLPLALVWRDRFIYGVLLLAALVPVSGVAVIFVVFAYQALLFFQAIPIWQFFTDTQWAPFFTNQRLGIVVLASATLMVTAIAMLVAVPLGVAAAIYLAEYASPALRRFLKPSLEALSGVPTIVFGYFALHFVTPHLQNVIPGLSSFNALSAGLVTGVLIVPLISSMSEDALRSVPRSLRDGAYAMGFTRWEVIQNIVVPMALPGMIASFTLAASRALSETMIAAIAAGQNPRLTLNPFTSVETMTGFIVQVSLGNVSSEFAFHTIFTVGLMLFILTLVLNHLGLWLVRHYQRLMASLQIPKVEAALKEAAIPSLPETLTIGASVTLPSPPLTEPPGAVNRHLVCRYWVNHLVGGLGLVAACIGVFILGLLALVVLRDGFARLDWQFLTSSMSRNSDETGIWIALQGTIWILSLTAAIAFPIGIGAAIFLEEYMADGWLSRWLELNIANAAAIPSIIYGLLGLSLFVRRFEGITGGSSILSASLVLSMIALPVLIVTARSALRAVPADLRQAGYAVGMSRWQVVWSIVLPTALPGVLTGVLLAWSRVVGETSPLIAIGASAFVSYSPSFSLAGLQSKFTTLPSQIFFWSVRSQPDFLANAAAAAIVLCWAVLVINVVAVLLRDRVRIHP